MAYRFVANLTHLAQIFKPGAGGFVNPDEIGGILLTHDVLGSIRWNAQLNSFVDTGAAAATEVDGPVVPDGFLQLIVMASITQSGSTVHNVRFEQVLPTAVELDITGSHTIAVATPGTDTHFGLGRMFVMGPGSKLRAKADSMAAGQMTLKMGYHTLNLGETVWTP